MAALPWEDYIPRDGEFPVKGYSLSSTLHSVPACQAIVKKAAAKRLGSVYGCETLPETGSRYQIQFAIIKDTATLYLDTSGEGLYKRGYRPATWRPPQGDPGRRPGSALPLPGPGPLLRSLLRQRHHSH